MLLFPADRSWYHLVLVFMKNVEQCTKCISRFAQDSIFSWHTAKERRRPKEKKLNVSIIFNCRTRRKTVWVNARTRKKERIHNNKRKRETESERRKKEKESRCPEESIFIWRLEKKNETDLFFFFFCVLFLYHALTHHHHHPWWLNNHDEIFFLYSYIEKSSIEL